MYLLVRTELNFRPFQLIDSTYGYGKEEDTPGFMHLP